MNRLPLAWTLVGPTGASRRSNVPGTLGGHKGSRIYGRLDCHCALRAIARGGYVTHRVFFLDERTARAAGYRACAKCMPAEYARWKRKTGATSTEGREARCAARINASNRIHAGRM